MNYKLLQIFRNTPFGRETFLQSLYFCKTIQAHPVVYIPESDKLLMYFPHDAIQIDLDSSYPTSPKTTKQQATALLKKWGSNPGKVSRFCLVDPRAPFILCDMVSK